MALNSDEYDDLCTAINPEYRKINKRQNEVSDRLSAILKDEEAKTLFGEYYEIFYTLEDIRTLAWFHLGFAAALRLLGASPSMEIIKGGKL